MLINTKTMLTTKIRKTISNNETKLKIDVVKKNVHTLRKRLYQLHRQNNDKKYCLRKHQIYIQVFHCTKI